MNKNLKDGMELVREDWNTIKKALENKSFQEDIKGYMAFLCNEEGKVSVKYNLIPLLAYNLVSNDKVKDDLKELNKKYQDICEETYVKDTFITKTVPVSKLPLFYKTVSLLELVATDIIPESNLEEVLRCEDYPEEIAVGYYTAKENKEMDKQEKEELSKEMCRIIEKANKKLWRKYKNESSFDMAEYICSSIKEGRNLLKPGANFAAIMYLSDNTDANISFVASMHYLQICLNYIVQDFAFATVQNRDTRYSIVNGHIALAERILTGMHRCEYSSLLLDHQEHIERYVDVDTKKENAKAFCQNAYQAYQSIHKDTSSPSLEVFEEYLKGSMYVQMLLSNIKEYQELYSDTLKTSATAHKKMKQAEKMLEKAKESSVNEAEHLLLQEQEKNKKAQSVIDQLEIENEKLRRMLTDAKEQIREKEEQIGILSSELEKKSELLPQEQTEPSEADIEKLSSLNVCFIGGHPNFTKKLREKFGKWKFIAEQQGNFPLNIFNGCDIVFQAEAHCNHSLSERRDKALGNSDTPFAYIGNITNVNLCIQKMVLICREKEML